MIVVAKLDQQTTLPAQTLCQNKACEQNANGKIVALCLHLFL